MASGGPPQKKKHHAPRDCMASGPRGPPWEEPLQRTPTRVCLSPSELIQHQPVLQVQLALRLHCEVWPQPVRVCLARLVELGRHSSLCSALLPAARGLPCKARGTVGPPLHSAEVWLLGFSEAGRDQNPWCRCQKRAWETSEPPSPKKSLRAFK